MKKLWSASNVKVYGGGVDEVEFLENMARIIGQHHYRQTTSSSGRSGTSYSESAAKERTLDIEDLAALPRGRAIVFSSGNRPTLVRTVPYWEGPHKTEVNTSKLTFEPGEQTHLTLPNTKPVNPWLTKGKGSR